MNSPTDVAEDFASQWTIAEKPVTNYGDEKIFTAKYSGSLGMGDFKEWWKSMDEDEIRKGAEALAFGDFEQPNFTAAGAWIK